MASYDRSAQKQAKKSKNKKSGGQPQGRRRKLYSPMIPYRKLANMLQSSGAEYAGREASRLKSDAAKGDNGAMANHLVAMASDGVGGIYGPATQELAKKATKFVK